MGQKQVAIVIPFYRNHISVYEAIALDQCFKVLANYPVIGVKPQHLDVPAAFLKFPFAEFKSFDDRYFANIDGYNALMLSSEFYEAFLDYEFILIHQLDAFVFADQLNEWCKRKYDYIGAPWLRDIDHPDLFKSLKSNLKYYFHVRNDVREPNGEPTKYQYENRVGNGGFSLRRVKKFYAIAAGQRPAIEKYLAIGGHHFNEDRFWSIEVNRKKKAIIIPDYKTGLKFAFELVPDRALRLNHQQLPFGCHAWDRYIDFWRPIFKQFGYVI